MGQKLVERAWGYVGRHPVISGVLVLVLLYLLFQLLPRHKEEPTSTFRECGAAESQKAIDAKIAGIRERLGDPVGRQYACQEFADQSAAPHFSAIENMDIEQQADCTFLNTESLAPRVADALARLRPMATKVCGPTLGNRINAAKQRAEFTSILLNDRAGEAFRKLDGKLESFAPREDLRRCLEAVSAGREPAVMRQPFVDLVAMCEVQLGIAAVKPEERWPLPDIVLDTPQSPTIANASDAGP